MVMRFASSSPLMRRTASDRGDIEPLGGRMRRRLTIAFSVATVALSGTGIIGAQQATDEWFTLSKLAPHVWAAVDNPKAKQRSYSNAGFVIGDDGVVVVDT